MIVFRPVGKIKEMADADAPTEKIAEASRCSVSTVQRRMRKIGVNRPVGRPSKLTDEQWDEIYELVKVKRQGQLDEIASKHGLTKRTIERKLKKMANAKSK